MSEMSELLRQYANDGCHKAFRELVERHVDLVYSTAVRRLGGDTHLAQDVTQIVFTNLARKARFLPANVVLGGWLYRDTCFRAAETLRNERRRRAREQTAVEMNALHDDAPTAWKQLEPVLDDALAQLGGHDRNAIVLRFFERRDLRAVGSALGTSEDAAQKRVGRALEKLRILLLRRGITLSVTALATALASDAIVAAPAGLAASLAGPALASAASSAGVTLTILKFMTISKLKITAVSALAIAGVATPLMIQHRAQTKLEENNNSLQAKLVEVEQENQRLSNVLARSNPTQRLSEEQMSELLKLRGQVGQLRSQTNELEKVRAENRQLRASTAKAPQNLPFIKSAAGEMDFPRENWAWKGYGDPHSAFQSAVWSASRGDFSNSLASLSPGMRQKWEQKAIGRSETEVGASIAQDFEHTKRFTILNKEAISEDEVILQIRVEGEKTPDTILEQRARMVKVGNEWKFDGFANSKGPGPSGK